MSSADFLSLPTEVLRQIITHTRLNDFENLLLSCKQVYNAGHLYIAEHINRKKWWGDLEVKFPRGGSWENYRYYDQLVYALVQMLRIIAVDPVVAEYVQSLTLHSVDGEWDFERTKTQFEGAYACKEDELADDTLLEEMICGSVWLRTAGCDPSLWTQTVLEAGKFEHNIEDEDNFDDEEPQSLLPVLALLLTKLTNLKCLSIKCNMQLPERSSPGGPITVEARVLLELMSLRVGKNRSQEEEEPAWICDNITGPPRCADDKRSTTLRLASSLPVSPMENLGDIHYCAPRGYHQHNHARNMNIFMTSPSVRRICATNVQAHQDEGGEYDWPCISTHENGTGLQCTSEFNGKQEVSYIDATDSSLLASREVSAVESLEMVSSCIDPQGINDLLGRMPDLASLRYTHEPKYLAIELDFDAGWFLRAIAEEGEMDYDTRMQPVDFFHGSDDENDDEDVDDEVGGVNVEDGEDEGDNDNDNDNDRTHASQITNLAIGLEDRFYGTICTGISAETMRKFTALETLSLDVRLFLGPTPESCERRDQHGNEDSANVQATRWNPDTDTLRLIDVLSPTLKELELFVPLDSGGHVHWHLRHWPRLLDGFREARQEKLPNLTSFSVVEETGSGEGRPIKYQEVAEAAGADFTSGYAAKMAWRRDFEEREGLVYAES